MKNERYGEETLRANKVSEKDHFSIPHAGSRPIALKDSAPEVPLLPRAVVPHDPSLHRLWTCPAKAYSCLKES